MALCTDAPNCTMPMHGSVPFPGDPDIAGIGVIIAFVLTSWLSFACVFIPCLAHYIFSLIRPNDPRRDLELSFPKTFQNLVLSLSDSQLVSGAAIIIVGFIRHCTMDQYHFYIVSLLAQLSFTTHQSTFIVIRDYLHSKTSTSWVRLGWVTVLTALVLLAELLTSQLDFLLDGGYGLSIQCNWNRILDPSSYTVPLMGWYVLFCIDVFWGYIDILNCLVLPELTTRLFAPVANGFSKINKLFRRVLDFPGYFHIYTTEMAARISWVPGKCLFRFLSFLSLVLYGLVLSLVRFLVSDACDVIRVFCLLVWATAELFFTRDLAIDNGLTSSEEGWGFGQQMAVLLFGLPLLAVFDACTERQGEHHSKRSKDTHLTHSNAVSCPSSQAPSTLGSQPLVEGTTSSSPVLTASPELSQSAFEVTESKALPNNSGKRDGLTKQFSMTVLGSRQTLANKGRWQALRGLRLLWSFLIATPLPNERRRDTEQRIGPPLRRSSSFESTLHPKASISGKGKPERDTRLTALDNMLLLSKVFRVWELILFTLFTIFVIVVSVKYGYIV